MDLTPGPVPDGEGPQRLSVSQANTYAKCARRWWWQYIAGIKDPPGPDAIRGTLVHKVLEHLCLLPPGQRTIDAAARIALEHWNTTDDGPVPAWVRRVAWRNVVRALRLPEVTEPAAAGVEVGFDVTLNGVPFRGFIDRVTNGPDGIEIDDYKDGNVPRYDDGRAEKKRQIVLYAAAYELGPQPLNPDGLVRPVAGSLIYTAAGVVDRYPITGQAVSSAVRWLRRQWDGIQTARVSGEFPTNPGPLCSWCPAVGRCPDGLRATATRAANPDKSLGEHGRLALTVEAAR